jgi:hypothetical protein
MRFIAVSIFIAAAAFVSFGQSGNELKVIDAVKQMDRQWIIEAYSSRDLSDFDRIVASDFRITGSNGRILTREQKRANVKGDYSEDPASGGVFKIDDGSHSGRMFGKDMAISTGRIIENYTWKTTKINGHVHFTNVYLKRNGKWQVVQSHFTNIKQT